MNGVSFYEISRGKLLVNYVRFGTGTMEEVRRMGRPACYVCLHGGLGEEQRALWLRMGFARFDEVSGRFKDKRQRGLVRHGASVSFVWTEARRIDGALAALRAFAEERNTARSARWLAIDAAGGQVIPMTKREAWHAIRCAASSSARNNVSYLSVKGSPDDLKLLFDRIEENLQWEQQRVQEDADAC